jgi:lipoate-protein ligase A
LAIIAALGELGVAAALRGGAGHLAAQRGPFFCFARHDPHDIVCRTGGRVLKIAGSAQRRLSGAVLEHGSILTGPPRSAAAAEGATDVETILGRPVAWDALVAAVVTAMSRKLAVELRPGEFSSVELAEARRLNERKYSNNAWTYKR